MKIWNSANAKGKIVKIENSANAKGKLTFCSRLDNGAFSLANKKERSPSSSKLFKDSPTNQNWLS